MKLTLKRFGEEFYFYSSQLVIFFAVILFLTSGSVPMGIASSVMVILLTFVQTVLLMGQGHKVVLRVLFSLVTPAGYSILRAATGTLDLLDMSTIFIWGAALYVGIFQAMSIGIRSGFLKRVAETALALGAAVIFMFLYYYLDLRLGLGKQLAAGEISQAEFARALQIGYFLKAFESFGRLPQHWFALLGIASFDAMLLAARMREISLGARVEKLMERPAIAAGASMPPPAAAQAGGTGAEPLPASQSIEGLPLAGLPLAGLPLAGLPLAGLPLAVNAPDAGNAIRRVQVTVVSSDIIAFTELSERIGPEKSVDVLNKYYSAWMQAAGGQGGRIVSITGDSVILVFGLVDDRDNAERGLAAARDFLADLPAFRDELAAMSLPSDFRVSIGVHSGMITTGRLGAAGERRLSAFGDAIAVAARLDSLCRELNQDLLVSHGLFRRLGLESQATLDRIGEVLLRKSTRPVPVYGRK